MDGAPIMLPPKAPPGFFPSIVCSCSAVVRNSSLFLLESPALTLASSSKTSRSLSLASALIRFASSYLDAPKKGCRFNFSSLRSTWLVSSKTVCERSMRKPLSAMLKRLRAVGSSSR